MVKSGMIQVYVDDKMLDRLNKARGIAKMSTYIRAVLENHFENNPTGCLSN